MRAMGSRGVDEEVKIIGNWAASTRDGRVDAVEGSWTNFADLKVRTLLGMLILEFDHLKVFKSWSWYRFICKWKPSGRPTKGVPCKPLSLAAPLRIRGNIAPHQTSPQHEIQNQDQKFQSTFEKLGIHSIGLTRSITHLPREKGDSK